MTSALMVQQSQIIAAERERVWRAITTPRHMTQWFGMDIDFARLAVGETMTFTYEGTPEPATITVVEAPERFAFEWTAEPGLAVTTLVTFVLEAVREGTRVTVTEQGFEALPDDVRDNRRDSNTNGWAIQLNNIARYLRETADV